MAAARAEVPEIEVRTRAELREWFSKNHATSKGAWIVTYKKASGEARIDAAVIGEEALCFGWVDSKVGKVDETRSKLLVTPRKPRSAWSKVNKGRIARLEEEGRMMPAGRAMVALAKKSGTWSALDEVEKGTVPPDLAARFAKERGPARANFDAFPRSAKRAILEWIQSAKRPETRAARIEETVVQARENVRANQWRQPGGR
jgi:uncharacterized protein YdeI (YjbR/CyaY-like superfamily)